MAGGIDISKGAALTLGELAGLAVVSVSLGANSLSDVLTSVGITTNLTGPYRDKQQNKTAVYSIIVPASTTTVNSSSLSDANSQISSGTISTGVKEKTVESKLYVFDAVLAAVHYSQLNLTKHPLQSGYNISDHAVLVQPTVVLEVGMSDAMAAYKPGMWSSNASKSVSAFQTLKALQSARTLFTLSTRQMTYSNMIITSISSPETVQTFAGMRASITFEQVFIVNAAVQELSARPNATDSTAQSSIQSQGISQPILNQHLLGASDLPISNSDSVLNSFGVPKGGAFSSNNLGVVR